MSWLPGRKSTTRDSRSSAAPKPPPPSQPAQPAELPLGDAHPPAGRTCFTCGLPSSFRCACGVDYCDCCGTCRRGQGCVECGRRIECAECKECAEAFLQHLPPELRATPWITPEPPEPR